MRFDRVKQHLSRDSLAARLGYTPTEKYLKQLFIRQSCEREVEYLRRIKEQQNQEMWAALKGYIYVHPLNESRGTYRLVWDISLDQIRAMVDEFQIAQNSLAYDMLMDSLLRATEQHLRHELSRRFPIIR